MAAVELQACENTGEQYVDALRWFRRWRALSRGRLSSIAHSQMRAPSSPKVAGAAPDGGARLVQRQG